LVIQVGDQIFQALFEKIKHRIKICGHQKNKIVIGLLAIINQMIKTFWSTPKNIHAY
jgi:hypothetical protein